MKLYLQCALLAFSLFSSFCYAFERSSWEEVYEKSLHKDGDSALQLLHDRYFALPSGAEKLYLASKIHGYFVLRSQPYFGEATSNQDAYSETERRFVEALNYEEALNYQKAEEAYLAFYSDMNEIGDQDGLVLFEYHLCRLYQRSGRPYKARFYCSQMDQRLLNSADPLFPRYRGLHLVANNLEFLGEYQEASETYELLLKLLPDYVDPSGVYNDVGLLMSTLGQHEAALEYLNKALEYRTEQNNTLLLAQVEHSLGDAYFKQGMYQESIRHFYQAEQRLSPTGYLFGLAYVHLGLGKAYIELGNFTEGDQHLLQALEYVNKHQDQNLKGLIYLALSQAYFKEQKYTQASNYANQAVTISDQASLPRIKAKAYLQLATVADTQQQYQQALVWYKQYAENELQVRDSEQRKAFAALNLSKAEFEEKHSANFWRENYQTLVKKYDFLKWQRISLSILILTLAVALPFAYYRPKKKSNSAKLDMLQGVIDRNAGLERLTKLKSCKQAEQTHLIALLDIDQLRQFNERFGYENGDKAMQNIFDALRSQFRNEDFLCRIGDDEFLLILPNCERSRAETRLFTLHHSVNAQTESATENPFNLSITMSYLALEGALANFHSIYPYLDKAMNIAKQQGRGGFIDAQDYTTVIQTASSPIYSK
ncbi:diguanylate cyclase [Vibrio mimicus]|nr:diguanylate cyclase [Vibrio mimicus]QXC59006.1 diguanylate cyclase [Vibrio mimicus]